MVVSECYRIVYECIFTSLYVCSCFDLKSYYFCFCANINKSARKSKWFKFWDTWLSFNIVFSSKYYWKRNKTDNKSSWNQSQYSTGQAFIKLFAHAYHILSFFLERKGGTDLNLNFIFEWSFKKLIYCKFTDEDIYRNR